MPHKTALTAELYEPGALLTSDDKAVFDGIVAELGKTKTTNVFPGQSAEVEAMVSDEALAGEAFRKDVLYLKELYKGRHVTQVLEDGTKVTLFGTRDDINPERIDDLYEVRELPTGEIECSAVIMPMPDQGYKYTLDADGVLKIQDVGRYVQRVYSRHEPAYKEAESFMMRRSLRTAGIAKRRWEDDPVAAHEADTHARDLTELQFGL